MKPLPVGAVAPRPAAPAKLEDWNTTGLRRAWFCSTAGAFPGAPQRVGATNAPIGSTQYMSVHVSLALLVSGVDAAAVPAMMNDESFRIPHDARTFVLNGTEILWVSSNTVSMAPFAPHTIRKSAARVTVAPTPSA